MAEIDWNQLESDARADDEARRRSVEGMSGRKKYKGFLVPADMLPEREAAWRDVIDESYSSQVSEGPGALAMKSFGEPGGMVPPTTGDPARDPDAGRALLTAGSVLPVGQAAQAGADVGITGMDIAAGDYLGAGISAASVLLPFVSAGVLKRIMNKEDLAAMGSFDELKALESDVLEGKIPHEEARARGLKIENEYMERASPDARTMANLDDPYYRAAMEDVHIGRDLREPDLDPVVPVSVETLANDVEQFRRIAAELPDNRMAQEMLADAERAVEEVQAARVRGGGPGGGGMGEFEAKRGEDLHPSVTEELSRIDESVKAWEAFRDAEIAAGRPEPVHPYMSGHEVQYRLEEDARRFGDADVEKKGMRRDVDLGDMPPDPDPVATSPNEPFEPLFGEANVEGVKEGMRRDIEDEFDRAYEQKLARGVNMESLDVPEPSASSIFKTSPPPPPKPLRPAVAARVPPAGEMLPFVSEDAARSIRSFAQETGNEEGAMDLIAALLKNADDFEAGRITESKARAVAAEITEPFRQQRIPYGVGGMKEERLSKPFMGGVKQSVSDRAAKATPEDVAREGRMTPTETGYREIEPPSETGAPKDVAGRGFASDLSTLQKQKKSKKPVRPAVRPPPMPPGMVRDLNRKAKEMFPAVQGKTRRGIKGSVSAEDIEVYDILSPEQKKQVRQAWKSESKANLQAAERYNKEWVASRRAALEASQPKPREIEEVPGVDLDAQEAFEREVREEQAAARGGFVGDEADYLEQVDAMKQQAARDRQLLEVGKRTVRLSADDTAKLQIEADRIGKEIRGTWDRIHATRAQARREGSWLRSDDPVHPRVKKDLQILEEDYRSLRKVIQAGEAESSFLAEVLKKAPVKRERPPLWRDTSHAGQYWEDQYSMGKRGWDED